MKKICPFCKTANEDVPRCIDCGWELSGVEGSEQPVVVTTRSGGQPLDAESLLGEPRPVAPGEAVLVAKLLAVLEALRIHADSIRIVAGDRGDINSITGRGFAAGVKSAVKCLFKQLALPDSEARNERSGRRNR